MLGAGPGDEDPLLPNGANPHPLPLVFDDFDLWHAQNDNIHAAPVDDVPVEPAAGDPVLMTPGNSPVHGAHEPAADHLFDQVDDPVDGEGSANNAAHPATPADDLGDGEGAPINDAHPAAPATVSAEASALSGGNSSFAARLTENVAPDHAALNNAPIGSLVVPVADYQSNQIHAIQHMIANIIGSAKDVLPTLSTSNIVGATCKMVTMETEAGLQDKSFLQINTISESPVQFHTSSVRIEEIPKISQPAVRIKKRKAKAPMSVAAIRRSGRIEILKAGYKEGAGSSASL
jgi:hypothetical protein